MKLKRCLSLVRASILDSLQFRGALILTFVGNLFYLLLIYYLWKAIFASSESDIINGMTFSDTMIYLVFASALFNFMEMWIVWGTGRNIQSGQIIVDLLKPIEFRSFVFSLIFICSIYFITLLDFLQEKFFCTFSPLFLINH